MTIEAILIDSREPEWVRTLTFGGIPTSVITLDTGDLWAITHDGHTIMIERKTPDDFLNSLKDERLMPQLARMAYPRQCEQLNGQPVTHWPYLLVTDEFKRATDGHVITERGVTGWQLSAVWGALLSIQEMGIFVDFCAGDPDYPAAVKRLGTRDHAGIANILPARQPVVLGAHEQLLTGLPGIGNDRAMGLMKWGENISNILVGLTDLSIPCPVSGVGEITRKRIRQFLGLNDKENLNLNMGQFDEVILQKG